MILVTGATGKVGSEAVRLRGVYGDAATSPVHEWDIAAVGARARVDGTHAGPSSSAVEEVLGRPARTFAEWAAARAGAFRNGEARPCARPAR